MPFIQVKLALDQPQSRAWIDGKEIDRNGLTALRVEHCSGEYPKLVLEYRGSLEVEVER